MTLSTSIHPICDAPSLSGRLVARRVAQPPYPLRRLLGASLPALALDMGSGPARSPAARAPADRARPANTGGSHALVIPRPKHEESEFLIGALAPLNTVRRRPGAPPNQPKISHSTSIPAAPIATLMPSSSSAHPAASCGGILNSPSRSAVASNSSRTLGDDWPARARDTLSAAGRFLSPRSAA